MKKEKYNSFYALLLIIGIWYILYFTVDSSIITSPGAVIKVFLMNFSSEILPHLLMSFYRIFVAVAISLFLGVGIGLLTGMHKKIDKFLSPLIYLLYPIPKIAFLPVFMLLFGLGDRSKIILLIVIVIFQIIVTTRDGVRGIDSNYFASARSLGMDRIDIYRHFILKFHRLKIYLKSSANCSTYSKSCNNFFLRIINWHC